MSADFYFLPLFLSLVLATWWLYSLRKRLWLRHPEAYATIGYKESDGAYMDALRTVYSIPFKTRLSGLPVHLKRELWLARIFILLTTSSFLALFVWVAFLS